MNKFISVVFVSATIAAFAATSLADVKVKSRQTVGGQGFETTTYIKGKRQRSETMGGMVNIMQCDLKRSLQLNGNSQTYTVTPFAPVTTVATTTKTSGSTTDKDGVVQTGGRVTTTVTTRDTGERKQMFGYTARHLIITIETVSSPDACDKSNTKMQTDGWYIDAAFALDCDNGMGGYGASYGRKTGCQDKFEVKTIGTAKRGFAVYEKMTMFDETGSESYSMINEVVEFSQAVLDAALFDVPVGFREVGDSAQLFSSPNSRSTDVFTNSVGPTAKISPSVPALGPKKPGVVRIGLAGIKTGSVADGVSASELALAIRNTLMQQVKGPSVEVVELTAKSDTAIAGEARSKECDFVVLITVSHKKGDGGFGMFKSVLGGIAPAVGVTGTGGYVVAGSAAGVAAQIKSKDEIGLDARLNKVDGTIVFERSFKAKAKSNGDDIITEVTSQAARSVVDFVRAK